MSTSNPPRVSARTRTQEDLFGLIARQEDMTRPELMRLTGMSRSTINNAVAKLIADGRVEETDLLSRGPGAGSGRPATRLVAVNEGSVVGAIDFGHNHVRAAIADASGRLIGERSVQSEVDVNADDAMDTATEMLRALLAEHDIASLAAVGAGIPGPVDRATGVVCSPTILAGWVDRRPQQELEQRLGTAVRVENDALLGALGELRAGAGRGHRDFLYIKASHGIGGGIVIDGRPFHGTNGLAGELGHIKLPGRAELCRCGDRGCLEAVVSVGEVQRQVLHAHPHLASPVAELFENADSVTGRILEEAGRILGTAIGSYCDLLDPSAVIIGGELPALGPWFFRGVDDALRRSVQPATARSLTIVPAELSAGAELRGAIDIAIAAALAA